MLKLHIDIETYSDEPLTGAASVGTHKYVQSEAFEVLMLCYSWELDGVRTPEYVVDTAQGEELPDDVFEALTDPTVEKVAHNAAFEFVCIARWWRIKLDISQWRCTMIKAAYLGLPLGLDKVGQVLKLKEQKDAKGKQLITYFCQPCRPTKANGGRTRNLPHHAPEKWVQFKSYCAQDVRSECDIDHYCERLPALPAHEWEYWFMDMRINDAGVSIDVEFIEAAIKSNEEFTAKVHAEMREITGISNPNSLHQLKAWLSEQGVTVDKLNKEYLLDVDLDKLPPQVARLLELRNLASKASISKYSKMLAYRCDGDLMFGLFQFYGANRTGREAGRGVQPQNLKKTFSNADKIAAIAARLHLTADGVREIVGDSLNTARDAVRLGIAELLYEDVPDVISKLVRTAIIAQDGHLLCVSDFAAIEARVLAWLAGEQWVLDVFNTHGKLYEAQASRMFNVPFEMVTKGSDLRAKGKIGTLALGYQGAVGALITMGALREGLLEEELPEIVTAYREANPETVKFWRALEDTARHVIENKTRRVLRLPHTTLTFSYERGFMFIELPSGRRLSYYGAKIGEKQYIADGGYWRRGKIMFWGLDQVRKVWRLMDTYGGSLAENVTQAIARDCLFDAMYRMRHLDIRMHIHDEIVVQAAARMAEATLKEMEHIMSISPLWASTLPLEGDGFISSYYKKDG